MWHRAATWYAWWCGTRKAARWRRATGASKFRDFSKGAGEIAYSTSMSRGRPDWWSRPLACAFLCLAASLAPAQIRTETRVVLVDTIVTNKQGDYIPGLAAKDFHLWEDNKEQTIKSVALEKGTTASRPHYLVLFFAPMQAAERMVARQAVSGFIDAHAEGNRKIAVVSFNGGMRIGQNFTGDAGRLKAAVNVAIASGATNGEVTTGISDSSALDTIRALGNLARSLSDLQGRKTIVLLNGGLSQSSVQKAELDRKSTTSE